ncbi:hypothetical protein OH76DRAFT_1302355, partial [Lentinus brumalis]
MRIDGSTQEKYELDPESGGILMKRLHARIASYNAVVIFLMKCNMDIKFIGSGEAAKALVYYVTDYITKASLPAHIGLGALSYAIQKTNERYPDATPEGVSKSALTATVNRMISRLEISHQQLMSFLIGGGDVYRSDTFSILHWGSFDRLFKRHFPQASPIAAEISEDNAEETFVLQLKSGSISASSQQQDYVYRPTEADFEVMSLYEFVGTTEKVAKKFLNYRGDDPAPEGLDNAGHVRRRRGRRPAPRGLFCSTEHTQHETHRVRKRTIWTVPVVLGDRVPRSDQSPEEKEKWARMMLILFVPWRKPSDLRNSTETWTDAFERQRHVIPSALMKIIDNMNVLSECRDVRDSASNLRRAEALAFMRDGLPDDGMEHSGSGEDTVGEDYELFDKSDLYNIYDSFDNDERLRVDLDNMVGPRARQVLDMCFTSGEGRRPSRKRKADAITVRTEDDDVDIQVQRAVMHDIKQQRRPNQETKDARRRKRRRVGDIEENVREATLQEATRTNGMSEVERIRQATEQVVLEMGLADNAEQERAFRLVANHLGNPTSSDQLLMYIAGVGGTGKTHVVKSILRLFELLGR